MRSYDVEDSDDDHDDSPEVQAAMAVLAGLWLSAEAPVASRMEKHQRTSFQMTAKTILHDFVSLVRKADSKGISRERGIPAAC
jgi:hypothetical protein